MTTNVFWSGTVSGRKVVSIFNNPTGQAGSNLPLNNPTTYLDRVYFDTRFEYFNIIEKIDFIQAFPLVEINTEDNGKKDKTPNLQPNQGTTIYTITQHGLSYVPSVILVDYDTREIIGSNTFVQNQNNNSFRILTLMADTTNVYLKETYYATLENLPSITRRYTLLICNNTANVPSISS